MPSKGGHERFQAGHGRQFREVACRRRRPRRSQQRGGGIELFFDEPLAEQIIALQVGRDLPSV